MSQILLSLRSAFLKHSPSEEGEVRLTLSHFGALHPEGGKGDILNVKLVKTEEGKEFLLEVPRGMTLCSNITLKLSRDEFTIFVSPNPRWTPPKCQLADRTLTTWRESLLYREVGIDTFLLVAIDGHAPPV